MYVHAIEFFKDTDRMFTQEIMHTMQERSYDAGVIIFHEGEPARHLYILLEGRIQLNSGKDGWVVYIANRSGEAFGWSSLMGRDSYSATAGTLMPTRLYLFERERFMAILNKDPRNGLVIYKNLALTLANRLIESYRVISDASGYMRYASQGSRQLEDVYE
jgi:CRP/FNR family cyclic AMP-dependent transcriptional regulator